MFIQWTRIVAFFIRVIGFCITWAKCETWGKSRHFIVAIRFSINMLNCLTQCSTCFWLTATVRSIRVILLWSDIKWSESVLLPVIDVIEYSLKGREGKLSNTHYSSATLSTSQFCSDSHSLLSFFILLCCKFFLKSNLKWIIYSQYQWSNYYPHLYSSITSLPYCTLLQCCNVL